MTPTRPEDNFLLHLLIEKTFRSMQCFTNKPSSEQTSYILHIYTAQSSLAWPYYFYFHPSSSTSFYSSLLLPSIPYLPSQFIIVYHVVAHTLSCKSVLCCVLILCILFVQSAILFVIAICDPVCESKMVLCISLTFFFIHSLLSVCVLTHGLGSSGFQTDVQWQHLKRAGDLGQWATRVSRIHLRWVFLSSPFLSSFFLLPIYLSQTPQAVAMGWQTARAGILLK